MRAYSLLGFVMTGLMLAACQPKLAPPPPPPPPPPPLPPHAGPPPAAHCVVAPFKINEGHEVEVLMTVGNDGGYCAARFTAADGRPFDAPLVPGVAQPLHGTPHIIKYDGKTSVEYIPTAGYHGHDHFAVRLIRKGEPGYSTLNVSITVE